MIRRTIRHAVQAVRPPAPLATFDASTIPIRSAAVSLSIGASLDAALSRLDLDFGARTLIVPDRRSSGAPGPRAAHAVAATLARTGVTRIGVPPDIDAKDMRRWIALATSAGAGVSVLGSAGWIRVVFGDRSHVLVDADLPAELHGDSRVVALSAPSGSGCLALWSAHVHPNTALRARVVKGAQLELGAAVDAQYLLVGEVGGTWMAMSATPAIVAELAARGIERLRERLNGYETPGPWEDSGVQHLSGLAQSSQAGTNLVLLARLEDNSAESLARQFSEMLGWRLELVVDDVGGSGGEG